MLLKIGKIAPEGMKRLSQSSAQFWMYLVIKVKSDAVKNSTAQEPGLLSPSIRANWKWSNWRWQE